MNHDHISVKLSSVKYSLIDRKHMRGRGRVHSFLVRQYNRAFRRQARSFIQEQNTSSDEVNS